MSPPLKLKPAASIAPVKVAQGCAAVQGLASLPVLDMYATVPADAGAADRNAVRARTITKKDAVLGVAGDILGLLYIGYLSWAELSDDFFGGV
jgi:hypothetical protein